MMRGIHRMAIVAALAVLLEAAAPPYQQYVIVGGKSVPAGDGSAGSAPQPVTNVGGSGTTSYTPLGCYQITSLAAAAHLPTVPAGTTLVSMTIEEASVRMRDDGTAPTTTSGLLLPPSGAWPYSGSFAAVEFIQIAPTATIDYCTYK